MSRSGFLRAPRAVRIAIALAITAVAGLVAVSAPLDGRADATTTPTCTSGVSTANALGIATSWTEFIKTNGVRAADSEGAIAYGGSFSGSNFPVGDRLPSSTLVDTPTLVIAGGTGSTKFNLARGSAYLSDYAPGKVNFNGGGHPLGANPIDFAAAFSDLETKSTTWGGAATTGTVTVVDGNVQNKPGGQDTVVLSGTNADLNVFNVASTTFGNKQVGIDVPQSSTVLINVRGGAVALNNTILFKEGGNWNQASDGVVKPGQNSAAGWPGVLWNFPTAATININTGAAFAGTVLAPWAAVTVQNAGHTIGQMIAKSFTSTKETHFNLFPSTSCLPGTPNPPTEPDPADVTITKSASSATSRGGVDVSYTLTATNVGASPAAGVVIRDQLPSGVTFVSATSPCTQAAGVVSCAVGNLAAGASTSVTVVVRANPIAGAGPPSHPQANHWLTPYKVEAHVDLEAGEQKSVTLACSPGGIVSDGMFRVDHVDQDTGSISNSVLVLSSQSTSVGSWKGVIRNDATGRAQGKAFIVCLPAQTEASDSQNRSGNTHQHALFADAALVASTTTYNPGLNTVVLTCPSGTVPVAPGFDQPAGGVTLVGSEYDSAHPRDWTFTLDATAPTTTTVSVRCLRTTVSSYAGHTHDLKFIHVVETVTVRGNTYEEGDEFQVTCPEDAKGIVGTWHLPPGVKHFGNDPRIKARAFRLFNDTGVDKQATLDLLCVRDRTTSEEMGTTEPVVVPNTATVSSTSADANAFNNSATATITVQPGSSTVTAFGAAKVAGSSLATTVISSMPGTGKVTVTAGGSLLAKGTVTLKPGKVSTASLKLTKAGGHKLASLTAVSVTVDPSRGKATTSTVSVRQPADR